MIQLLGIPADFNIFNQSSKNYLIVTSLKFLFNFLTLRYFIACYRKMGRRVQRMVLQEREAALALTKNSTRSGTGTGSVFQPPYGQWTAPSWGGGGA
jgi:hypothetical protein